MSSSFSAYACVGVMVPLDKLYKGFSKRVCDHPEFTSKYCPECGKKQLVTGKEPIPEFLPDGTKASDFKPLVCGLPAKELDYEDLVLVSEAILEISDGDHYEMYVPPDVEGIRKLLREKLEPVGLWDESKFGLWCVAEVG